MSAIRSTGMKPEMIVRRLAHRLGYRYRLHRRDLPGTPDLVFSPRRKIVFVHGCFWHSHGCKVGKRNIGTNEGYWGRKLERNRARDERNLAALEAAGWGVLIVWECETKGRDALAARLKSFLGPGASDQVAAVSSQLETPAENRSMMSARPQSLGAVK